MCQFLVIQLVFLRPLKCVCFFSPRPSNFSRRILPYFTLKLHNQKNPLPKKNNFSPSWSRYTPQLRKNRVVDFEKQSQQFQRWPPRDAAEAQRRLARFDEELERQRAKLERPVMGPLVDWFGIGWYCWWKKSCTSWYVFWPVINRVLHIQTWCRFYKSRFMGLRMYI